MFVDTKEDLRCVLYDPARRCRILIQPLRMYLLQEVCGVVMKVLRVNKDSLMNVLETFLHDPLVEWIKKQDEVKSVCVGKGCFGTRGACQHGISIPMH